MAIHSSCTGSEHQPGADYRGCEGSSQSPVPCVLTLEPLREAAVPPVERSAAGRGFERHIGGRTGCGGGDHASVWRASEPGENASSISCMPVEDVD